MTHGEGMEQGRHMGHHMGGRGMRMQGRKGMGGPMGMPGMHGMGMHEMRMCPWCRGTGLIEFKGHRVEGPYGMVATARNELLIDKVKEKLNEKYGSELDAMAGEVVELAEEFKKLRSKHMNKAAEIRERMRNLLSGEEQEEGEEE